MHDDELDMNAALMLDGNAVAGELDAIFGRDMTMAVTRCAACAADTMVGSLMAFTHAPGVVLRCPACQMEIARIVKAPATYYVDMRGASYMRLGRTP